MWMTRVVERMGLIAMTGNHSVRLLSSHFEMKLLFLFLLFRVPFGGLVLVVLAVVVFLLPRPPSN